MTKPTRHDRDDAKRIAAGIENLLRLGLHKNPDLVAHVLAHGRDCEGARAWGGGSGEVAVATSGISRPTEQRAIRGDGPDAAEQLAADLRALDVLVGRIVGGWSDVCAHLPAGTGAEAPRCSECSRVPDARLKGGRCNACYLRGRRSA